MALATTTLSVACAADDNYITVASATSVAAGRLLRIDDEWMKVRQDYSSGTSVPVLRGLNGSRRVEHKITANVVHGLATDFDAAPNQAAVTVPGARRRRTISLTAAATLELPAAGEDLTVILNGTSVIALTIPVPTADMDGVELNILANGAAAHTLTFTGGLSDAGSSYDVITMNGTKRVAHKFVAVNATWVAYCQPGMAGTLTNIVSTLA